MGGYSDKLSYEERWQVIQYIRSLQAASKKLEYSEKLNTLNTTDTPYSVVASKMAAPAQPAAMESDTTAMHKGSEGKESKH